jgi:hypothetical protein
MRRSLARVRLRAVVVMDKRSPPSFRFNIGREHRGNPQAPVGPAAAPFQIPPSALFAARKQRLGNKIHHPHSSRNPHPPPRLVPAHSAGTTRQRRCLPFVVVQGRRWTSALSHPYFLCPLWILRLTDYPKSEITIQHPSVQHGERTAPFRMPQEHNLNVATGTKPSISVKTLLLIQSSGADQYP